MSRIAAALNLEESPVAQQHYEAAHERDTQPLARRERIAEVAAGAGMVTAALGLAVFVPAGRDLDVAVMLLLTLALIVAARVKFDVAGSFTFATQPVFVAMLFVLPPTVVPLLVAIALPIAKLPEVIRGERPLGRAAIATADGWFALGPALVLTLAGTPEAGATSVFLLLGALLSQFAFDFTAAALRERAAGGPSLREQAREAGWIYSVDALLAPIGFLAALAAEQHQWAVALLLPLLALLQVFSLERKWRISYILELSQAYRGTATLLGDVVEADHAYTGDHSREVVELSVAVAEEIGLSPHEQRIVEFAALLHDVGKLAVPKEIIDKPGPLDDDEWEVMRLHTIEGEAMLAKVGGVLGETGLVVRASHEHYDGSGYPDGLAGDDIPIEARVVSACDAFSAMTTDRSYRRARSRAAAVAELAHCSGTQFDPAVVHALIQIAGFAGDGHDDRGSRRFVRSVSAAELDERDIRA
jgi:HD-GYP domain-containing protein (c-di-GMP phosphodiesterase class II)